MKSLVVSGIVSALFLAGAAQAQQPQPKPAATWSGCCGLAPWAEPGPMRSPSTQGGSVLFRGYGGLVVGSAARHSIALKGRIPARYANLRNPLPPTPQNAQRGAALYDAHCASCHGATGLGDGPDARTRMPPPAHLGWIARVPANRRDGFLYWSTAEGGARFGTAMPAYKGKLSDEEIWSVVGYIEARLPQAQTAAR